MSDIYKTNNQIIYTVPAIPQAGKEILRYAVEAYAFVMWPRRFFTFGELAQGIRATFDLSNPVTARAVQVLEFCETWKEQA
jgi:hypothetical protein